MTIKFSMDRIKNMDQLYTWTPTYSEELGCPGEEEHYHGTDYCKQVKGDNAWTADFACIQCGKFGVSINEEFLPIGRCCYCGWDNELEKCD